METKTIVMCVVALLLGILMADMLQNVCGCKDIVEGQGSSAARTHPDPSPSPSPAPSTDQDTVCGYIFRACDTGEEGCADGKKFLKEILAPNEMCTGMKQDFSLPACKSGNGRAQGRWGWSWDGDGDGAGGGLCVKWAAQTPGPSPTPPGPGPISSPIPIPIPVPSPPPTDTGPDGAGPDVAGPDGAGPDESPTQTICSTGRCKLTFDSAGDATIHLNDCGE